MMDDPALAIAANLAKQFEGFSATSYPDPASGGDPWTIGYGTTRDALGNPVTSQTPPMDADTALALLARDMSAALATVRAKVGVPITDNQAAALADFVYNEGAGAFTVSTLLRLLNGGDYASAAMQFPRWVYADGKVMPGLVRRREAERAMFVGAP